MELIKKQEVVELLEDEQMHLDSWGETDAAIAVAKVKMLVDDEEPVRAIIIPENATNGDVIRAILPTANIWKFDDSLMAVDFDGDMAIKTFPTQWWNTLYKQDTDIKATEIGYLKVGDTFFFETHEYRITGLKDKTINSVEAVRTDSGKSMSFDVSVNVYIRN